MSELEGTYFSSYFMIEETETQSANVTLRGRTEDQSWHRGLQKQFAGFLTTENTEPGTETRPLCDLLSVMRGEKRKKKNLRVRTAAWVTPILFCSPMSLVPLLHLYSANILDLLDHLQNFIKYLPGLCPKGINIGE